MKIFHQVLFIAAVIIMAVGHAALTEEPFIENGEPEPDKGLLEMDLRVEFVPEEGIESQEIRVVNEDDGQEVFQLTIEELNQWTEDNWDVFDEEPEVGTWPVDPSGFGFFDRVASIAPDNERFVFSVSDYAVLTTVSFVIVVYIDSGEMYMMDEPARGSVEEYSWSEGGDMIAYTLGTARAGGDFLRVDDVGKMQTIFTLSEEELLSILDPDEELVEMGQFAPVFSELEWSENRLHFSTEHPTDDQVRWSVAAELEEQLTEKEEELEKMPVKLEELKDETIKPDFDKDTYISFPNFNHKFFYPAEQPRYPEGKPRDVFGQQPQLTREFTFIFVRT